MSFPTINKQTSAIRAAIRDLNRELDHMNSLDDDDVRVDLTETRDGLAAALTTLYKYKQLRELLYTAVYDAKSEVGMDE